MVSPISFENILRTIIKPCFMMAIRTYSKPSGLIMLLIQATSPISFEEVLKTAIKPKLFHFGFMMVQRVFPNSTRKCGLEIGSVVDNLPVLLGRVWTTYHISLFLSTWYDVL